MKYLNNTELLSFISSNHTLEAKELSELAELLEEKCNSEISGIKSKIESLELIKDDSETFRKIFSVYLTIMTENGLEIRKYQKHCRSCIITESQVREMAARIHEFWIQEMIAKEDSEQVDSDTEYLDFNNLDTSLQKEYFELIYILPLFMKKAGYELIRKAEAEFINTKDAEKLARIIHATYQNAMLGNSEDTKQLFENMYYSSPEESDHIPAFDLLPESYKIANIDSAYHLPTKLLSVGYRIMKFTDYLEQFGDKKQDVDVVNIPLLRLTDHEVETIAKIEHDRWSWERRLDGWTYSPERDNEKKLHNCLLAYDDLPEEEKIKDRKLSKLIPVLLKEIAYVAVHVSPYKTQDLPYVKNDWGLISEIKTEISGLKATLENESGKRYDSTFDSIFNALTNLTGSFSAGKRIQNSFLTPTWKFKEFLTDSFVLFKPKDIVSGDFYYINKIGNEVIYVAADCTGHGIPAAILTSTCYKLLDFAIGELKYNSPAKITSYVMKGIKSMFQDENLNYAGFGMDFTICALNVLTKTLHFTGYGNPLYCFRNDEFLEIKGLNSLGDYSNEEDFVEHELQLSSGDTIYTFSDGYQDQTGGKDQKRFKSGKLKKLFKEIQSEEMSVQCEILNHQIEEWRRNETYCEQSDDILLIGVKIN